MLLLLSVYIVFLRLISEIYIIQIDIILKKKKKYVTTSCMSFGCVIKCVDENPKLLLKSGIVERGKKIKNECIASLDV